MESISKSNSWDPEQIEELVKLMDQFDCPKDFDCYKSDFENLCKVKLSGADSVIECLSENRNNCLFSLAFGYSYFCQCPVRVYIAKNFNK